MPHRLLMKIQIADTHLLLVFSPFTIFNITAQQRCVSVSFFWRENFPLKKQLNSFQKIKSGMKINLIPTQSKETYLPGKRKYNSFPDKIKILLLLPRSQHDGYSNKLSLLWIDGGQVARIWPFRADEGLNYNLLNTPFLFVVWWARWFVIAQQIYQKNWVFSNFMNNSLGFLWYIHVLCVIPWYLIIYCVNFCENLNLNSFICPKSNSSFREDYQVFSKRRDVLFTLIFLPVKKNQR